MKKRFIYAALSLTSLLCGIFVAFCITQRSFARGFFGDILIVVFIYTSIKMIFSKLSPGYAAPGVFLFALFVEFIQYTGLPKLLNPESMITVLTLGSTFDPFDIAAYAIGALIIYIIDSVSIQKIEN